MLDPAAPGSAVFVAPDGGVYVDRDGTSGSTLARWRRAFDPRMMRRRARWAAVLHPLLIVGFVAIGVLAGSGVVALAAVVLGTPNGLDQDVVGGAIGALVGLAGSLLLAVRAARRPEWPMVVRVPDEVVVSAPADAPAADVWRWATVCDREAGQRRSIGYETYVERPMMLDAARAAAERYTEDYRAYVAVADELGLVARPPAVDLDDPLH